MGKASGMSGGRATRNQIAEEQEGMIAISITARIDAQMSQSFPQMRGRFEGRQTSYQFPMRYGDRARSAQYTV
jgi:hypothetical protein